MHRRFWSIAALCTLFALLATVATASAVMAQNRVEPTKPTTEQPYPSKPQPALSAAPFVTADGSRAQLQPLPLQPAQEQAPDVPADWWWIAFQSYRSNNWEIYRTRGNGNDFAQLTFDTAADTLPNLNQGASAIVFVSTRAGNPEIYRMNADGSNQIRLTNQPLTDTHPIWSPDSTQIAFVTQRDGNAEVYRMNADGSAQQRLTNDAAFDLFPHWSPDGQQLVWVRAAGENGWLWLMNRDGSNARAISGPLRYLQHPVWSPNGREIAFDYDPDRDGFNELGILTIADGSIRLFQDWSLPAPSSGQELWMGAWSPNGAGITYTALSYFWQPVSNGYRLYWERAEVSGVCMTNHCDGTVVGVQSQSSDTDLLPSVQSADHLSPQTAVDLLPVYKRRTNLFVTWGGIDRGPSGIATYDVQIRSDTSAEWQDWLRYTYQLGQRFDYSGTAGSASTVHFRSRAVDNAENIEPWPANPNGDTTVTFYAATLAGRVTDMRGIGRAGRALPLLPAGLTDVQTDRQGDYFVRLPTSGEYQFNGLRVSTDGDRVQPFYLDPAQNLIQNGDFEAFTPLAAWQADGTITPTLTISNVSSGLQGVHLGVDCAHACVTVDSNSPLVPGNNYRPLWTPDGRFHLFYDSFDSHPGKVYHSERLAAGLWSTPEYLADGAAYNLQAVGDRNGNLFLAWGLTLPDANKVVTLAYSPEGGWGPPIPLATGEDPQVTIGEDGAVHLLYLQRCNPNCWESALVYRWRTAQGSWSPARIISSEGYGDYRIVMGQDNTAHLFWYRSNEKYRYSNSPPRLLYYQSYRQGSPTQPATIIDTQEIFSKPAVDREGALHLFSGDNGGVFYTATPLANAGSESEFVIDSSRQVAEWSVNGTLHLFGSSNSGSTNPWRYRFKPADAVWSTPQAIDLNDHFLRWLAVDAQGQFQATSYDGDYIQFPPKVGAGHSAVAQTVTIPAHLHEPTLSWMAETQGSGMGASSFQVTVGAGLSETVLYSTTAALPWQLQWAALTPWLGQTITVTFAVSQAADEIPFRVFLDHIALGAWETPVPERVTPSTVEAGVQTVIVISGANFIATPQVTVGGKPLTTVRQLHASALEATLPGTLPPGVHDLVVTNPSGVVTVLPNAIKVGKQLYLPVIQR